MKNIIKILLLQLFLFSKGYSQDLILNGDFEDVNICTEHLAPCSPEAWRLTSTLLPGNYNSGDNNFISFVVFNSSMKNIRSYLQSRLANDLVKGKRYKLSMDISPSTIQINSIGAILSDTMILSKSNQRLDFEPSIVFENNKKLLKHKKSESWLHLEKEFVAESSANFIIIGCFLSDKDLIYKFSRNALKPYRDYHYTIDNICLIPLDESYDLEIIQATKNDIYSQDYRHPVPDELFDIPKSKGEATEPINQISIIDTLILYDDLVFGFDSYEPSEYLIQKIDSVFENVTLSIDTILVYGHTDNVGTDEYNNELSLRRAKSVSDYIAAHKIITEDRLNYLGKGSGFPIASNKTEIGRYKNRRVEIIIKYKISR